MFSLLVSVIALGSALPQQASLLREIVPNPTGSNGYEEYLMACDVVRGSSVRWLVDATPDQLERVVLAYEAPQPANSEAAPARPSPAQYQVAKRNRGRSVLQLRREALREAGRALDLVARGNRKHVFDPRTNVGWDVTYPELSEMRVLGRLAIAAAYVAHADGDPKKANQYLFDALEMAHQVGKGVIITRLVAVSIQSMIFSAYEKFLPFLSEADSDRLRTAANAWISNPPTVLKSIDAEFEFMQRHTKTMFDRVEDANGLLFSEDKQSIAEKTAGELLTRMSDADKQKVIRICQDRLQRQRELTASAYRRPEREWESPIASGEPEFPVTRPVKTPEDFADFIGTMTTPAFSLVGGIEIRNRTQFRLLALTGAVVKFRWEHDRLPTRLDEAVAESEILDPANGDRFQYEIQPGGFRIYSLGTKSTGEIGLTYSNPRSQPGLPPPPAP